MQRQTQFSRTTKETKIQGTLHLDGSGKYTIQTGIGYLDHMLETFTFHSTMDLELQCTGDLQVCPHHTIEDIAIVLGETIHKILGEKKGIQRFSTHYIPMDESLTRTSIDLSGRPFHVLRGELGLLPIGNFPIEMVKHFFYSFAMNAQATLHQEILYGENDHHKVESLFKGLAKTIAEAIQTTDSKKTVASVKGKL